MNLMERKCRCVELEERVLKAEERYNDLESEIKKGKEEFESLELRFKELESEKLVMEEELRNLKESKKDSLFEQIMVNKASLAVKEAEDWKRKFEELVDTVRKLDEMGAFRYSEFELDENLKVGLELARIKFPVEKKIESCKVYEDALSKEGVAYNQRSNSTYITTPVKDNIMGVHSGNVSSRRQLNKMLVFETDACKSTDVVDLSDCESEERSEKESDAMYTLEERSVEDEDVEDCEVNTSAPVSGRKRKLVIASDSENDDDDDNVPISTLKKLKPPNQEMSDLVDTLTTGENVSGRLRRQRRVGSRLSKQRAPEEMLSEGKSKERLVGIPTTGNAKDDETEEESERESESESLDGFIVDDDDSHETASENSIEAGEEESDGEIGYADVISRLRRDKNREKKQKWEYEADMLADFGKDPELCMKAVCVLYRFQTEDEKVSRSSHVSNGRGFSKFDAERGTRIGKFLTDGDPEGDLKKSTEELESFEFDAVEICRSLAGRYSKQLFQIYNNREDPFFALPASP